MSSPNTPMGEREISARVKMLTTAGADCLTSGANDSWICTAEAGTARSVFCALIVPAVIAVRPMATQRVRIRRFNGVSLKDAVPDRFLASIPRLVPCLDDK